ncbi:hypothetical protein E2C01_010700 [Portunus trituberculatus]|uniref:Uncharacterized protein n=1 Tax=Portunus trituberculatus TaxID=210409 RepID=A0A5B7D949_PORTR|nr:hypothetical protein [Portunus trituberculatus]
MMASGRFLWGHTASPWIQAAAPPPTTGANRLATTLTNSPTHHTVTNTHNSPHRHQHSQLTTPSPTLINSAKQMAPSMESSPQAAHTAKDMPTLPT